MTEGEENIIIKGVLLEAISTQIASASWTPAR